MEDERRDLPSGDRDRLVALEGALNFRDLGGYPTRDGRRVAWGRVFRSDGLHELSDADLEVLHRLGIQVVCDLRSANELGVDVSRFEAPRRVHLPIGGAASRAPSVLELVKLGRIEALGVEAVVGIYELMLEHGADVFATVLREVADPAHHPLVFHCTAGKDRTGITAMLLLSVLGVGDDDILDDYELTTRYGGHRRVEQLRPELEAAGVDVDAVLAFLVAPREVMAATMARLRARWGSAERYLTEHARLEPDVLAALPAALLETGEG